MTAAAGARAAGFGRFDFRELVTAYDFLARLRDDEPANWSDVLPYLDSVEGARFLAGCEAGVKAVADGVLEGSEHVRVALREALRELREPEIKNLGRAIIARLQQAQALRVWPSPMARAELVWQIDQRLARVIADGILGADARPAELARLGLEDRVRLVELARDASALGEGILDALLCVDPQEAVRLAEDRRLLPDERALAVQHALSLDVPLLDLVRTLKRSERLRAALFERLAGSQVAVAEWVLERAAPSCRTAREIEGLRGAARTFDLPASVEDHAWRLAAEVRRGRPKSTPLAAAVLSWMASKLSGGLPVRGESLSDTHLQREAERLARVAGERGLNALVRDTKRGTDARRWLRALADSKASRRSS